MPSLQELDTFERQLSRVRTGHSDLHTLLGGLFNDHARLLDDYRSLKSDYEEEKVAREKYKRLARGPNNDPFVLVLVDGNSYIFQEQLLKDGEHGGAEAARLLLANVKSSLRKSSLQADCRIVVRIFADLNGLSKALAKHGMVGNHARSITSFTASFSQTQPLFDVIDSGEARERFGAGESAKIEENFRMFAGTSVCGHIVFAACNDSSLLPLLTPYQDRPDKITLVKSGKWIPEFGKLGLPVEQYADVFRTSLLGQPEAPSDSATTIQTIGYTSAAAENAWIVRRQTPSSPASWAPPPEEVHSDDSVTLNRARVRPEGTRLPLRRAPDDDLASMLPVPAPGNNTLVPINRHEQRIDTYLPKPAVRDVDLYHRRSCLRKFCNDFHLAGWICEKGRTCPFDHGPISEGERLVLRAYVREWLCPQEGSCRVIDCNYGHVCVRKSCDGPVRGSMCRLLPEMHEMDLDVAAWVPGEENNGEGGFLANTAANTKWYPHKAKNKDIRTVARLQTTRPAISPGHELGNLPWWRKPMPVEDATSVNLIDLSESSDETGSIHQSDESVSAQHMGRRRSNEENYVAKDNDHEPAAYEAANGVEGQDNRAAEAEYHNVDHTDEEL